MVLRTLGRLVLVPFAFVIGAGVAAFILVTLGLEHLTRALHDQKADLGTLEVLFELVSKGGMLASGATLLPALAIVLVGEVSRIRSWLYYMLGGGAALAVIPLFANGPVLDPANAPPALVWQVMATAGFAGGLVYWLMAGRTA